ADAVQRLAAQVERDEHDVRAPDGVVVPIGEEGVERLLAGMATRPVPAVVTDRDRLGESDVEAGRPGNRGGHLVHLEGVREAGALMVLGEHEDLRLAGQPSKRRRVQDAVPVPLEAGPLRIRLLRALAVTGAPGPRGASPQQLVLTLLPLLTTPGPARRQP